MTIAYILYCTDCGKPKDHVPFRLGSDGHIEFLCPRCGKVMEKRALTGSDAK